MIRKRNSDWRLAIVVGASSMMSFAALVAVIALILWDKSPAVAPVPIEQLGLHSQHRSLAYEYVVGSTPFRIVSIGGDEVSQDNTKRNVRLWDAVTKLSMDGKPSGEHFPNVAQQVGDCVSWGAMNAVRYRMAWQISNGRRQELKNGFAPYLYGTSRVLVGRGQLGCREDGSVGAWAAKAYTIYGWISDRESKVPYSGKVAQDWGCKGPPKDLVEIGKTRGGQTSPITSAHMACDAVCNGYPVTIASDFGSRSMTPRDGRIVAKWNATWPHQMCLIGYDGTATSGERYFYVINSWGPTAHPSPLQGEPPGGFWITWRDVERITSQGDSWGFSDVAGFPADEIDWSVFRELGMM